MLRGGHAAPQLSRCVVLEIKREQDLKSGFVQLLAEMLVIANKYDFHDYFALVTNAHVLSLEPRRV